MLNVGIKKVVISFVAGVTDMSITTAVKAAWLVDTAVHARSCLVVVSVSTELALEKVH